MNIHSLDLSIIIIYMFICIYLGIRKSAHAKDLKEYAIGGNNISTFALVATFFAGYIDAGSTAGMVERIYSLGMYYGVSCLLIPLFWFVTSYLFSDNIARFTNCISLPDIMGLVYGKLAKHVTVALSIITCIGVIAINISAVGHLFNHFLGLSLLNGMLICSFVLCINTFMGGAKSLVVTDIFQFIIFYLAIPIMCAIALNDIGGIEALNAKLPKEMTTINFETQSIATFCGFIFYALLPVANTTFIQRFLMARNAIKLKKVFLNTALIAFPFTTVMVLIGLMARVLAPDIEPNQAFYFLISEYMPIGMIGLMISGLLAVIMSTANTWINSASVIIAKDIFQANNQNISSKKLLLSARLSNIIMTALAILVAMHGGSIMELVWLTDNFWFPVMFVPIIFAFNGGKTTPLTFLISMLVAVIATCVTWYLEGQLDTLSLLFGTLASLVAFLFTHNFQILYGKVKGLKDSTATFNFRAIKHNIFTLDTEAINALPLFIFMVFQFVPSILESAISNTLDNTSISLLKILPLLFTMILATNDYWNPMFRKNILKPLWVGHLFFSLAFCPIYLLLVSPNTILWIMNLILCILVLSMFVKKPKVFFGICAMFALAWQFSIDTVGVKLSSDGDMLIIAGIYAAIGIIVINIMRQNFDDKLIEASNTASYIAHEAKSPMASVAMFVEILQNELAELKVSEKSSLKIKSLDEVSKQLTHLTKKGLNTINSVLNSNTYSQINAKDLITEVSKDYTSKQIQLGNIDEFEFFGSRDGIKIVLNNLLNNALKYAGSKATITISAQKRSIIVEDNGVGIDPDLLPHIFEPGVTSFGTGYGLSLCKKIIEDMGGDITCKSSFGSYTQFIIKLS